jgi:signal transduction histidine kinase
MMVVKGITFCLFLIFGRSLILSVIHEISLRERLEKAYEELKKLDTAKSEFISMASHQLRTPLSAIKGYISMIIEGSYGQIPELVKEKLQNVFTSNERLIQIVNTLLDISKIDLGKMEIKKEPVQIEEIIQSCYDDLKIEAQKKGLNFVFEKPETPLPKINADPLRIRQVFMNLIDNAIKYTPKGEIKMTVSQKGNSILFLIKDSGAGLTEKEKKEIFQSFTRGSAGLDYFIEGTGLGLSIAKKITELHQGKIWAESEGKDKGSTFFVELPIQ